MTAGHEPLDMNREIELKLECEPAALERVRRSRVLSRLQAGPARARLLHSVYFDTPGFALLKDGLALRVRETEGKRIQTLKTGSEGGTLASNRGEWETPLASGEEAPALNHLPADLRARIVELANGEAISPRLTSRIRRTARMLRTPEGDEIELAIDNGVLSADGREMPVSEFELELKRGAPAGLYRLALELADIVPVRIGLRSKAERALALAGDEKPAAIRAEMLSLAPGLTVEDAYVLILRHCLTHLLMNEAVTVDGSLSEGLHQMRVALRRMRSAFTVFRRVIGKDHVRRLSQEARWLATSIGRARDFDVFTSEILTPVEAGSPGDEGLAALRAAAEKARASAWAGARASLRSSRMTRFVLELALHLDERSWRGAAGQDTAVLGAPIGDFASRALDRRYRSVARLGRHIEDLDTDERHDLRKRLKRLRYASGFFASLYPHAATRRYFRALSQLQDDFGALNDVETAGAIIKELAAIEPDLAAQGKRVLAHHERRARKQWQSALDEWRAFRDEGVFWR